MLTIQIALGIMFGWIAIQLIQNPKRIQDTWKNIHLSISRTIQKYSDAWNEVGEYAPKHTHHRKENITPTTMVTVERKDENPYSTTETIILVLSASLFCLTAICILTSW